MSRYFVVMCEKSGGVTGYGKTEFKRDGGVVRFNKEEDAKKKAVSLNFQMNHVHATAVYRYWVESRES